MFDKQFFKKKNFFFLKNLKKFFFWQKTKIIFKGRIYKIKKNFSVLTPRINIFQQRFISYKNFFIKRQKNNWKLFLTKSSYQQIVKLLFRPINLYTFKGFQLTSKVLKKKKKIKTN